MRSLLAILIFLPVFCQAQLAKITLETTESDFIRLFPGCERNYEAESFWINDTTTVSKVNGNVRWRVYRDSVSAYYFESKTMKGPSQEFPKVDSSDVHNMRESAEILRRKIELAHGKPLRYLNLPLIRNNPMKTQIVYLAEWEITKGEIIRICISSALEIENQINASIADIKKSERYMLYVTVDARTTFTRSQFDIGKTTSDFLSSHPSLKSKENQAGQHVFVIADTATCENAEWKFIFWNQKIIFIGYDAWLGTDYLSASDAAAYSVGKTKANSILKDAQSIFGLPDSLKNDCPANYATVPRNLSYSIDYIYSQWRGKEFNANLKFAEQGGGKNSSAVFNIQLEYTRSE